MLRFKIPNLVLHFSLHQSKIRMRIFNRTQFSLSIRPKITQKVGFSKLKPKYQHSKITLGRWMWHWFWIRKTKWLLLTSSRDLIWITLLVSRLILELKRLLFSSTLLPPYKSLISLFKHRWQHQLLLRLSSTSIFQRAIINLLFSHNLNRLYSSIHLNSNRIPLMSSSIRTPSQNNSFLRLTSQKPFNQLRFNHSNSSLSPLFKLTLYLSFNWLLNPYKTSNSWFLVLNLTINKGFLFRLTSLSKVHRVSW